jgi:hypothetical protein
MMCPPKRVKSSSQFNGDLFEFIDRRMLDIHFMETPRFARHVTGHDMHVKMRDRLTGTHAVILKDVHAYCTEGLHHGAGKTLRLAVNGTKEVRLQLQNRLPVFVRDDQERTSLELRAVHKRRSPVILRDECASLDAVEIIAEWATRMYRDFEHLDQAILKALTSSRRVRVAANAVRCFGADSDPAILPIGLHFSQRFARQKVFHPRDERRLEE